MAQGIDTATLTQAERFVIDRIASAGRVPVIDQIAAAIHKTPRDLSALPEQLPAYAVLLSLKPTHIAALAARLNAHPEHFANLQKCADYIVDRARFADVEAELQQLATPPDDGPKVA